MQQILDKYDCVRSPPTIKEVANQLETTTEVVNSLIRFASHQQVLTDLGNGFFIATDIFRQLCNELQELFDQKSQRSVAEIRDHWQLTRKHTIPLLEYCDKNDITRRDGDLRQAGSDLKLHCAS